MFFLLNSFVFSAFVGTLLDLTQTFEMRCYLRSLNISHKDYATGENVHRKIQVATGEHDELLSLEREVV